MFFLNNIALNIRGTVSDTGIIVFFFHTLEYKPNTSTKWMQTLTMQLFCLQNDIFLPSSRFVCFTYMCSNLLNRSPQVLTWELLFKFSFRVPASLCVCWNKALWHKLSTFPKIKFCISDTDTTVCLQQIQSNIIQRPSNW